jgi:V/A-type H+-transporting ATPase subunit E
MLKTVGNLGALSEATVRKARQETAQILERAHRVAERDLEKARDQAERIKNARTEQTKTRLALEKKQTRSRIRLEARKKRMTWMEERIEAVFREALLRLAALPRDEAYQKILKGSILEGIAVLNKEHVRIVLNEKDRSLFDQKFFQTLSEDSDLPVALILSEEIHRASGGAIVRSEDGRVAFDNTFEARLARMKDGLRGEVAEELF